MTIANAGRNRPRLDRGGLTKDRGGLDRARENDRVHRGSSSVRQSSPGARPSIYKHVLVFSRTRVNGLRWVRRPSP